MRSKIITIWFILIISTFLPFWLISANAYDTTQQENTSEGNIINAGIYDISIGNFDFTKGTYFIDFYLVFKGDNQNITSASFELMNGRSTSKSNIYEEKTNETSDVWYRIQANLFITPEFKNYPFDSQNLKIIIEDSKYNSSILTYSQLTDATGMDDRFKLSGWNIQGYDLNAQEHEYPLSEEYWKKIDYTKQVNRFGAIFIITLPFHCIYNSLVWLK